MRYVKPINSHYEIIDGQRVLVRQFASPTGGEFTITGDKHQRNKGREAGGRFVYSERFK